MQATGVLPGAVKRPARASGERAVVWVLAYSAAMVVG